MPALLFVALIVVPIAELYVIIQIGSWIGVLPTVALLLVDSVVGATLLKREGRRTWAAFRAATTSSRMPTREVADGALVIFGGALLLTPGFLSDVLGLACILPPSRALLRRTLLRLVGRRLFGPVPDLLRRRTASRRVVEGEVLREDGPGQQ